MFADVDIALPGGAAGNPKEIFRFIESNTIWSVTIYCRLLQYPLHPL